MTLEVKAQSVTKLLLGALTLLFVAHVAVLVMHVSMDLPYTTGLNLLFNFDREQSVPALFSSLILALAAILLWTCGRMHHSRGDSAKFWNFLALIFVYLAVDESVGLHERLSKPMDERFGSDMMFSFGWLIPYQIAVTVIGLLSIRFLWNLPRRTAMYFMASGIVFLSGAIGMEILAARQAELFGNTSTLQYLVIATAEEVLEMLGVVMFISSMLEHMTVNFGPVVLSTKAQADSA